MRWRTRRTTSTGSSSLRWWPTQTGQSQCGCSTNLVASLLFYDVLLVVTPTVGRGGDAYKFAEHSTEVALVTKACILADIGNRLIVLCQQLLGTADTIPVEILYKRVLIYQQHEQRTPGFQRQLDHLAGAEGHFLAHDRSPGQNRDTELRIIRADDPCLVLPLS